VPEVHWSDIGGYGDVKQKLQESVTLPLERPEVFARLGIRPPRGVLLFGPPGCSKTLMAKAVATESKMNFIAVKGPELFSKFVGESEKAVASVFKKARNAAPSIIFFDEIDAMATRRGSSGDTGSHVTDRVLTQLLTEMDGISTRINLSVVVIAATNRPDLLDPALLRPGRFDRLVYVSLPDEAARREVFAVHLKKMKHEDDIDVGELARLTDGYSGAEIAAVCREAAMNALRETANATKITIENLTHAMETVKPRTPRVLLEWYQTFEGQRKY
jgi:SpoVK/Ycf46/Vps4 family AAA+-type ATPase